MFRRDDIDQTKHRFIMLMVTLIMFSSYLHVTVNGQVIKATRLCVDTEVTVVKGGSGKIQFIQQVPASAISCTIKVKGFDPHLSLELSNTRRHPYVSFPGLDKQHSSNCPVGGESYPAILIDNVTYCIKGSQSTNQVVIKTTDNHFDVFLQNAIDSQSFSFHFYSSVAQCKGKNVLMAPFHLNRLSGVIVSDYNLTKQTPFSAYEQCHANIHGLSEVVLKIEILYINGMKGRLGIGYLNITEADKNGTTLLMWPRNGFVQILMYTTDTTDESFNHSFQLRYTILHCGDLPRVRYVNKTLPKPPWVIGTKVDVNISCDDGQKIFGLPIMECTLNSTTQTAEWVAPFCADISDIGQVPADDNPLRSKLLITGLILGGFTIVFAISVVVVFYMLEKRKKPRRQSRLLMKYAAALKKENETKAALIFGQLLNRESRANQRNEQALIT